MTIQIEEWEPDTCSCIILASWDDTISPSPLSIVSFLFKDASHSILPDVTAFSAIHDENLRMNTVLQAAIDNLATQLSSTGAAGGTLKDGITYNFTLTGTAPNRVLNVSFTGITLTNGQKNTLQNWCNTHIGAGKVVVS